MIKQRRVHFFLKGKLDRMHIFPHAFNIAACRDAVIVENAETVANIFQLTNIMR